MNSGYAALLALVAASPLVAGPLEDYSRDYIGLYSPTADCVGQEFYLSLEPDRVFLGETLCQIGGIQSQPGGGLALNLNACVAEGDPAADQSIIVTLLGDTQLGLGFHTDWTLFRCAKG